MASPPLCPACGHDLFEAVEFDVTEVTSTLRQLNLLCPGCGERFPLSNEQTWVWLARLWGRPEAGPADGASFSLGIDADRFRDCLERALELLPPDASDSEVDATLLCLWLASARSGDWDDELDCKKLVDQAQAESTLAEEAEDLGRWFDASIFAATKAPAAQLLPVETGLDFTRIALTGIRYARPWARWHGRKPPGPDAQPRGRSVDAAVEQKLLALLKWRDIRGRRLGEREIARRAGTSRWTVQRLKREHDL